MKKRRVASLFVGCVLLVAQAFATVVIDFESYGPGTSLGTVTTPDGNQVTFGVGLAAPTYPAYVAGVGAPLEAFQPNDTPDLPALIGNRFLTDELNGPVWDYDYFITFQIPVVYLGLHILDYRRDGDWSDAPGPGSSAHLIGYADSSFTTPIAITSFTLTAFNPPDGNVQWLEITNPPAPIYAARITFEGNDPGTGIDNVTFVSLPEPTTLGLVGVGLLGLALRRRRWSGL